MQVFGIYLWLLQSYKQTEWLVTFTKKRVKLCEFILKCKPSEPSQLFKIINENTQEVKYERFLLDKHFQTRSQGGGNLKTIR